MRLLSQRRRPWRSVAVALAVSVVLGSSAQGGEESAAPEPLSCGVPVVRRLEPAAVDSYRLSVGSDTVVLVEAADTAGTIGLLKLHADEIGETCAGALALPGPGDTPVDISDCIGDDAGTYTVTANVVSEAPDNCGPPVPCGWTASVRHLRVPGAVDSYTFSGQRGERVTLRASDVRGTLGSVRLRVFDPDGDLVNGGDSCGGALNLRLDKTGTHTLLVSACGLPKSGLYGIAFQAPTCPAGPDITYFGLARADGVPMSPRTYDRDGRPVYEPSGESGFFLVIEARPGASNDAVGFDAFQYNANDPSVLPDMQVLLSRPLGNGSAAVCDETFPNQGGVPGVFPLDFARTQAVADAINDFGCRFDNGAGVPVGVPSIDACTFFPDGEYHFVDPNSTLQFCAPIARAWAFHSGTTIVKARARDQRGALGAAREIAVRVGSSRCVGDCNEDFFVTVDELVAGVNIALGNVPLDQCPPFDANGDGRVTVDELLKAVNSLLVGCAE